MPAPQAVFYVYHHYDEQGVLRYVGMGHGDRYVRKYGRNPHWNNVFKRHTLRAEIICKNLLREDALKLEILHIFMAKLKGCPLTNKSPGGEMPPVRYGPMPEQTRRKISDSKLGHTVSLCSRLKMSLAKQNMSEDTRRKLSDSARGNTIWLGKHHSEYSRRKMSEAGKGRKRSRDAVRKGLLSRIGVPRSEETKAKISNSEKGKFVSAETRAKLSLSHIGKVLTEDTKRKMSENMKRIWQERRKNILSHPSSAD